MTEKKRSISALPSSSFEAVVREWATVAKYRESASIWYHNKSDLLWRFRNLFDDKVLYKKYFGTKKIHVIDAESEPFDDPNELFDIISRKSADSEKDIFFLIGIDKLLLEHNTKLLASIMHRDAHIHTGSYLLFFTLDFTHPQFRGLFGPFTTSIQKVIIHPIHSLEDTIQYVRHQALEWGVKLVEKEILRIAKETGGVFLFPKEALRFLRDHPKAPLEEALQHKEMEWRAEMVYTHFLPSEQAVVKCVTAGTTITDPHELHSLEFLQKAGYVTKKNNTYSLTLPPLTRYIQSLSTTMKLLWNEDGRIFLNGVSIEGNFSQKEQRLLTFLFSHVGKLVTRDEISAYLSKNHADDVYSDWAIDQLVSRVRKTFAHLSIPTNVLKTQYGKGFIFLPKKEEV